MTSLSYISNIPSHDTLSMGPRSVVFLGSTGSIGTNALEVIRKTENDFQVLALAAANNISLLAEQALKWQPPYLGVLTNEGAQKLRSHLPSTYSPSIVVGQEGYCQLASLDTADIVLSAQVGAAGLAPTMAAVQAGKWIALANKESLVLAGDLIRQECKKTGAMILPVDSEHNALFQSLMGHQADDVTALHLTASGGPFLGQDTLFLQDVSPEQALAHPNWNMGAKISIDSATLMNKGLEVIEASYLYGLSLEHVQVVIHPESIVHSLVEYCDGSFIAHMGTPDMQIPIAFCLTYPKRLSLPGKSLDLTTLGTLRFEKPDTQAFPCLELSRESLRQGPSYPVVLNAANEVAVDLFLKKRISFLDIPKLITMSLENHAGIALDSLETIMELDKETRSVVLKKLLPKQ